MSEPPYTRRARRASVVRLDPGAPEDLFALRDAMVLDDDAEVRATAILRLDRHAARRLVVYLRDAVHDPSMLVREAAFVALARAEDRESLPRALHACRYDRGFRVRRAALLFAARTCALDALPVLSIASRDPFWRVRVAARRAGAALDASMDVAQPDLHPLAISTPSGVEDPDPAVVTARLLRLRGAIDPRELVSSLAQSHLALRRVAVNEIAARGDDEALYAVTRWLVDDRVPYAPSAAEAALARCGSRAASVADRILEQRDTEPAGPLAWAIANATRAPAWATMTDFAAHSDVRVRRATVRRLVEAAPTREALFEVMERLLHDADPRTRGDAGAWLARTASRSAREALLRLAPSLPASVRALLVGLCLGAHEIGALRALAEDPHSGVRADALAALRERGAVGASEGRALELDEDPWIRRAVLDPARASAAMRDPSVLVRRAAFEAMVADERRSWAESGVDEPDAALRARAAAVLSCSDSDRATTALLRLSRDGDLGVRSAAIPALAERLDRVLSLLEGGTLENSERIAAYTVLRLGGVCPDGHGEHDPAVLQHVALLDDVLRERAPTVSSTASRATSRPVSHEHTRTLGRTGLRVHPFGISGAHGLAFDDFTLAHEQAANLFFWEPSHRELTRFLRSRRDTVVVAGTYHADAASVERDVVRTLRALRRDTLDVFLGFWTRSPARLDETHDALLRLVGRGLIRAAGISTHDRELAARAADRGVDVVMVRHSAAHRGAEAALFAQCKARGTGVLTFSNVCYGRMLHKTPILAAPVTAPDCYRYSLSQPGVHACIAAPRRHAELIENLVVIDDPLMSAERQAELRAHGTHVYERSKAWSAETWGVAEHPRPRIHARHAAEAMRDVLDDVTEEL